MTTALERFKGRAEKTKKLNEQNLSITHHTGDQISQALGTIELMEESIRFIPGKPSIGHGTTGHQTLKDANNLPR